MPGRLLAAVLQGVEPEVGELRDVLTGGPDAEDAAHVGRVYGRVGRHDRFDGPASRLGERSWHLVGALPRTSKCRFPTPQAGETRDRQPPRLASSSASARHDPLELGEVQALVGAVGAGVGVLDAGDQHARRRERLEELRDERDRPAHAHVDRRGAVPGLGEGRARGVVRRAGGVDLGGLAGVDDASGRGRRPTGRASRGGRAGTPARSRWCRPARGAARSGRGRSGSGCWRSRRPWARRGR